MTSPRSAAGLAPEVAARWNAAAAHVGPADRTATERALARLAGVLGGAPPRQVRWFADPLEGALAAALLARQGVRPVGLPGDLSGFVPRGVGLARQRQGLEVAAQVGAARWTGIDRMLAAQLLEPAPADALERARAGIGSAAAPAARGRWAMLVPDPVPVPPSAPVARGHLAPHFAAQLDLDLRLGAPHPLCEPLVALASACGWWWLCGEIALCTERPVRFALDDADRLHLAGEPALAWSSGWGLHAWRGVRLPHAYRGDPADLDPVHVIGLGDRPLRRALIERIGLARVIASLVTRVMDEEGGRLLHRLDLAGDEPVLALEVRCPSTGHRHFLRVPPRTRTCHEAVAWTFSIAGAAYRPLAES